MASPYRDDFEKGFRIFADLTRDQYGRISNTTRYVIGVYKKDSVYGLYKITSASYTYEVDKVKKDDLGGVSFEEFLSNMGYEEISPDLTTLSPKSGSNPEEYATGLEYPGTIKKYSGVLFHGSYDPSFPLIFQGKKEFPMSSHLYSIKDRRALSFSTDFDRAKSFGSYTFKYYVRNLNVYYVCPDEDDFDDIVYNKKIDALALPPGRYKEKEITLVNRAACKKFSLLSFLFSSKKGGMFESDLNINFARRNGVFETIIKPSFKSAFGESLEKIVEIAFQNKKYVEKYDTYKGSYTLSYKKDDFFVGVSIDTRFFNDTCLIIRDFPNTLNSVRLYGTPDILYAKVKENKDRIVSILKKMDG